MKLTDLIERLQEMKKEYGNINVSMSNRYLWENIDEEMFDSMFTIKRYDFQSGTEYELVIRNEE
jgi:hypothetical protein